MSSISTLLSVAERISLIADATQRKLRYVVFLGAVVSVFFAFNAFSVDSVWWWNSLKIVTLLLPAIIWCVVLLVLNQLKKAPELISQLVHDGSGIAGNLRNLSLKEPNGLRSLFSTIKALKQEEGFELIFDTISGVSLIINPLFAFLAMLAMAILFLFIIIAPFVLLL